MHHNFNYKTKKDMFFPRNVITNHHPLVKTYHNRKQKSISNPPNAGFDPPNAEI